jgi:hypothetical protein
MYTPEMSTAFHAVIPPKNFGVILMDNEDYINIMVDPQHILDLSEDDRQTAVNYINAVKKALEDAGAIVQIIREAIDNDQLD